MARLSLPLRFHLAGEAVDGETLLLEDSGPWVVVLTTTIPELGLSLTSIYLGHDRCEQTLVGELLDAGDVASTPELVKRQVALESGAFTYERRAFLYDHLGRLQDGAVSRYERDLQVVGSERAARALDPLAAG